VTSFNNFLLPGPRLELDGVAVRDTDADSDGLLDDWEAFYFSNLTNAATGDLDLDGLTNGQEQDAGTDPTAGQSALDASIEIGTGGAIRLEVSHASSRTYELEFTENFVGWTVLTNDPTYDLFAGTIHWKDEASGATNRFYRVVATPSL
jgi:hypothetical protein